MKAVLKDHNSVLPVSQNGNNYMPTIPAHKTVTISGFHQKGEELFFGRQLVKPDQKQDLHQGAFNTLQSVRLEVSPSEYINIDIAIDTNNKPL